MLVANMITQQVYKKILINRDGAFGDSIVALPSLSVIRQNHPSAQIDLLSITNSQVSFIELNLDKHLINKLYVVKKNERKYILKTLTSLIPHLR